METNTLVIHRQMRQWGIECVAKVLTKKVKVNFGLDRVATCDPNSLEPINVSECQTISFHEFQIRMLKDKSTLDYCIVGNELKHYVGIGWVTERVITYNDLKLYPRVI